MNEVRPRVSVAIPVYNAGRYLAATMQAVLQQTYGDFEVVVSDNASTDDTLEVLSRFDDPRVRLVRNDRNLGAVENFRRVVAEARGRYVKLLGADDILYPTCLERQAAVLDAAANTGVVLVTAPHDVIDEHGKRIMARGFRSEGRTSGAAAIRRLARAGANLVGEPTAAMFRADAYAAAGPWSEEARYVVDVDMWMRLLLVGDLFVIGETLSAFRVHGGTWSRELSDTQTEDMRTLLERLAADRSYPVTGADARLGTARAWVNTQLRHAFYRVFLRAAAVPHAPD